MAVQDADSTAVGDFVPRNGGERASRFSAKVSKVRWEVFPRGLWERNVVIESVCLKYEIGVDTFQRKRATQTYEPV